MDLLAVEGVVGALGYSPPGNLLAGEGDQRLAAALAAEVVQDEDAVWLKLQGEREKREKIKKSCSMKTPGGAHEAGDELNEKAHHTGPVK